MAAKFKRPILAIEGVGVGRTAVIKPGTGRRFNKIVTHISATGQQLADIVEDFTIEVNGKPQRRYTPAELQRELLLMGEAGATTYGVRNDVAGEQIDVPHWFREPWRKGFKAGRSLAWATGDIPEDEFQLKVRFKATAHASVAMTATAEYDNPIDANGNAAPMGPIIKWVQEDIDVTGVSKNYQIPKDKGALVSVTFHDPDISKVELIIGDVTVREVNKQEADSDLENEGMTPSDDHFTLVLDSDDDIESVIPLRGQKNSYFKLTLSDGTPRVIRALVQFYGQRD